MTTIEKLLPLLPKWERLPLPFAEVGDDDRQGMIRSQQNRYGTSREFAEHREYSHGDDPRYVDWKQYGRTDRFFVKKFHDESSSAAVILLDASPSMFFRGGTSDSELSRPSESPSKWEYGKWLTGLYLWRLLRDRKQVAVHLFGSHVLTDESCHSWFAATGSGIARWKTILDTLDTTSLPSPPMSFSRSLPSSTSVWETVQRYPNRSAQRRLFVFITDGMFDDEDHIVQQCHFLAAKRHRICFLHILTPDELEFPYHRTFQFEDMAGNQKRVLDAARIAASYKKRLADFLHRLETGIHGIRVSYRFHRTDTPLVEF